MLRRLVFSAIISSAFILLSGCSNISTRTNRFVHATHSESKQELVRLRRMANDLWMRYHCITISNEATNRELGKWDDFVKEAVKSDYSSNCLTSPLSPLRHSEFASGMACKGGEGGVVGKNLDNKVSLVRKINKESSRAKEGGYYDDHKNTVIIPYKTIFTTDELKDELKYALLELKLETLSRIQKIACRGGFKPPPYMEEYKALTERINPEHADKFGDDFNKYSEDELRALITYMNEKYHEEAESIEYNLQFFQDALDHELGHFFLDDVEEGGLGLLYDKRYEGPTPDEILDYVYNRFKGSSFLNRLSEIYTPVTWCHTLEGYNSPQPPFGKGGIGEIKELIEYILTQRASYRVYVVANYDTKGIAWHVGTLRFIGIDEDEVVNMGNTDELPPYFVPHNGQILFNPVRKEIVSVGAGLARSYKMAEIRQAEAYLKEYEATLLKHELFVRMIDALMSINLEDKSEDRDFSNNNYDLKPLLNEADLRMFERMKFMGKPLFRKAVEKYRLGLQLLKNGYDPQRVRKELEYATHYAYKGKEYFWQENGFKIIGEIPFLRSE